MSRTRFMALIPQAGALVMCGGAGWAAATVHMPLAWLIGPLMMMAILCLAGWPVKPIAGSRQAGQILVGTALGLYFTPEAAGHVVRYLPLMMASAIGCILAGGLAGLFLVRFAGASRTTAFFASVPGGVAEMSVLGERYGADTGAVALAQSLRIACVVLTLPPALTFIGAAGTDAYIPSAVAFHLGGYVAMMAVATALALALWRLKVTNPWVLGALATGMLVAVGRFDVSSVPVPMVNLGQILIGCALGSRFQRAFLLSAPRFVLAAVASNLLMVAICVVFAWLMHFAVAIPFPTLALALSPGGIAEMSLTARTLALGVPMVTAFHVIRILTIILGTAHLFSGVRAVRTRLRRRPPVMRQG